MTVVVSLEGWSSVAVTVLEPPLSEIEPGVRTRVTAGVASLSSRVTVSPPEGATLKPGAVVAVTTTVSFGSSTLSSAGARVNVPVSLVSPVAIVIVKLGTAV